MSEPSSDEDLALACRAGDQTSCNGLHARCRPAAVALGARYYGGRYTDEAFNDAFVHCVARLDPDRGTFRACFWARFRGALLNARDKDRRGGLTQVPRATEAIDPRELGEAPTHDPDPTAAAGLAGADHDRIRATLARLPEHHRVVVVAKILEDRSLAEAAEYLGWRVGQVRHTLADALDRLRRLLE